MCESLCTWWKRDTIVSNSHKNSGRISATEGKLSDFVFAVLQDTAILYKKEMQEIVFVVRQMDRKSDFECDKIRVGPVEKEKLWVWSTLP